MCAAELFQMVADDYMLSPENMRRVETIMLAAHGERRSCCLVSS
jgi:hypothetical protein